MLLFLNNTLLIHSQVNKIFLIVYFHYQVIHTLFVELSYDSIFNCLLFLTQLTHVHNNAHLLLKYQISHLLSHQKQLVLFLHTIEPNSFKIMNLYCSLFKVMIFFKFQQPKVIMQLLFIIRMNIIKNQSQNSVHIVQLKCVNFSMKQILL